MKITNEIVAFEIIYKSKNTLKEIEDLFINNFAN